jgi:hypothetical protein
MRQLVRWRSRALGAVTLAAGVSITLASASVRAQAEEAAPAEAEAADAEARLLFEAGARAFEDGRFEVALARFREAYALSHQPMLLYNIGQAADRVRLDREAFVAFEAYLAAVPDARNRREVEGRVAALRRVIDLSASEPVAESVVAPDSAPPGAAATTFAAPPAAGGDAQVVAVDGARPATPSQRSWPLAALGWTSLALGVTGMGVAAAALALRNAEAETFNGPRCVVAGRTRSEACASHLDAATLWEGVGIGTLLGGGAFSIAGAVLLAVDAASEANEDVSPRLACAASFGPSWGLTCSGTF